MENLELIASLDEAIRIIAAARIAGRLASGSSVIWQLSDHAASHLDKQIKELLAPPPAEPTPATHCKDSDCTLDPETQECVQCGVWHGAPCVDCGQRGYHKNLCASDEGNRFSPVASKGIHAL